MNIVGLDPQTATESQLRAWYALDAAIEGEQLCDRSPVMPYEESIGWLLNRGAVRPQSHRVVLDGDRVIGASRLAWWGNQADRNAELTVNVDRDYRRRGIGTELLRATVRAAAESGRDMLSLEVVAGATGEAFVKRLGVERRTLERRSLCNTAEIDRDRLASWVAAAPTDVYDLVHWKGSSPEEWLGELCRVKESINDAPLDDLSMGRIEYDGSIVREFEAGAARRAQQHWVWCAVHRETRELAGVTEMLVPSHWPVMAYQEDTAVDPAHRRRGIGRWIKAALMLELLEARPGTEWVQTWNADSNASMLGINVAMGFRPAEEWGIWQAPADDLLKRLEES